MKHSMMLPHDYELAQSKREADMKKYTCEIMDCTDEDLRQEYIDETTNEFDDVIWISDWCTPSLDYATCTELEEMAANYGVTIRIIVAN
jgi:hypothetical protein